MNPRNSNISKLSPPPFTVPNELTGDGQGKGRQRPTLRAPAALADYQLPDPTWRWVRYVMLSHCVMPRLISLTGSSKFWMVDMRGDGEVGLVLLLKPSWTHCPVGSARWL
jgi:hypothetical protein